ncbi:MAG: PEP-CTERM sorting domain-containing protein [Gemmatimonadaceae bacterium]|jgi:hypothetical protein|nr:PEP-CTERM sorting domain-containing protein [Gemmatimonadaceae bacterium]
MRTIAKSFLAVALAAAPALAQPGPFAGSANIGNIQFLMTTVASSDNTPGFPVGSMTGFVAPGTLTFNATTIGISRFFCIDDNAQITIPGISDVWVTRLDATDWTRTKIGNGNAANNALAASRYTQATGYAAAVTFGDIAFNQNQQRNMWRATDGVAAINAPTTAAFAATNWYVVTGRDNFGQQQELLATVVPEPSTYALVATGLVALGVAARRRRRA